MASIHAANAAIFLVLMHKGRGAETSSERQVLSRPAVWRGDRNGCGLSVCEEGIRGMARRGGAGQARTATSAKVPLGAIAMPTGFSNWALAPTPSLEPRVLPASVVVSPVAISTRRTRLPPDSCDTSWGHTLRVVEPHRRSQYMLSWHHLSGNFAA